MRSEPLVIRRDGAVFSLRRIGDDEMRRLGRRSTAVEDDPLFWLQWHCLQRHAGGLTLPEFLVGMSRRFGPSGFAFDDYKSSFCFPLHMTTEKAGVRGDYLLLVHDWKGGLDAQLLRNDGKRSSAFGPIQRHVDAEFARDDYRYVMNFLTGYLEGMQTSLARFVSKVPAFVQRVDAAFLLYGYRDGRPFEQHFEREEGYRDALARVPSDRLDLGVDLELDLVC